MNKQTIKLSFIIPFYNSASYINKCLDSLYNQDIPETDYEVICVNDCSPDGTRDIIVSYQKLHSNLRIIDHAVNKRQGETRNTGLRAAVGEYCWFIDPDDFIEQNCLKRLFKIIDENNLDVLNFDYYSYYSDGTTKPVSISDETDVISGAEWMMNLNNNFDENASPWRRIVRRKIYTDNNLFFPPRRYEDQFFTMFTVYNALKFKHLKEYVYFYFINPTSTIQEKLTAINYISAIECGADYLGYFEKIKSDNPVFAQKIKMSGLWKINFGCKEIPYFSNAYRKRLIKCIKPHLLLIQRSGYYQGFSKKYFNHFEFYNAVFFVISPLLRLLRNLKRILKYKLKSIKQV